MSHDMRKLLVVDDRDLDELCLGFEGCLRATNVVAAKVHVERHEPEVVLLDMMLPANADDLRAEIVNFANVREFVKDLNALRADRRPAVVLVTQHDDFDVNQKQEIRNWWSDGWIAGLVPKTSAWDTCRLVLEMHVRSIFDSRLFASHVGRTSGIATRNRTMQAVLQNVARLSTSDVSVLIRGESGTGKELVARALHDGSSRRRGPFVAVNLAELASGVIESELFGHVRGAFAGAEQDRVGRLEAAHGGTLFLDEIGDVSMDVQVKLLRVLQERKITRVGDNTEIPFDVRLVTATHRDLEQRVRDGLFREDLMYRLKVTTVELPPLRDRLDDVPVLVDHLRRDVATEIGKPVPEFADAAVEALQSYPWPGNVRELRNLLATLVALDEDGVVTVDDVNDGLRKLMRRSDRAADAPAPPRAPQLDPARVATTLAEAAGTTFVDVLQHRYPTAESIPDDEIGVLCDRLRQEAVEAQQADADKRKSWKAPNWHRLGRRRANFTRDAAILVRLFARVVDAWSNGDRARQLFGRGVEQGLAGKCNEQNCVHARKCILYLALFPTESHPKVILHSLYDQNEEAVKSVTYDSKTGTLLLPGLVDVAGRNDKKAGKELSLGPELRDCC